jgi:hypothetical protein
LYWSLIRRSCWSYRSSKPLGPLFGHEREFLRNNDDYPLRFDNSKAIRELGIQYLDIETSIRDMVVEMRK